MTLEFATAFLAAQKQFPTVHKGKTAKIETNKGSYSYKYADLGDVLEGVMPILHEHGLALSQPSVTVDGRVGVATRLYHESGHVEDFGHVVLAAGNTPQSAGSAMTYARRYALCAALGVVADEDDDGRAASEAPPADAVTLLQNRLKTTALKLAGDKTLAQEFYVSYAPEVWTLGNVETAERAMEAGVKREH